MDYGKYYEKTYYDTQIGTDGTPYSEQPWRDRFDAIAKQIVESIGPRSVLDVGCAYGYLVGSLRRLGVDAYGIDASAHAIESADAEIQPYCAVCSAVDPLPEHFPKHFDLVVTIEVIEHLYEEDCDTFIKNICSYADDILFSSTPSDIADVTHFNVQQPEYFAKRFVREGFVRNFPYDATYISPQALRFTRMQDLELPRVVEGYERFVRQHRTTAESTEMELRTHIWNLNAEIQRQQGVIEGLQAEMQEKESALADSLSQNKKISRDYESVKKRVANVKRQQAEISEQLDDRDRELAAEQQNAQNWQNMYTEISNARFWKATKPLRVVSGGAKAAVRFGTYCLEDPSRISHGIQYIREEGLSGIRGRIRQSGVSGVPAGEPYDSWFRRHKVTDHELRTQSGVVFRLMPQISILVPAYKTPAKLLKQMIESVQAQSYRNWELCIADASENDYDVMPLVKEYQEQDTRIRYQLLDENRTIAENTNAALAMAEGEYIGLLDHDDLLEPNALFEIVRAINEDPRQDLFYTDEDKIDYEGTQYLDPYFKPDFNEILLRSNNYICHFLVVKRELAEQIGGFRKEYNGSQDYDFILRCTEQAEKICHIPMPLYHWRISKSSTAQRPENKMYCFEAGKRSIEDHLTRVGVSGTVACMQELGSYRATYDVQEQPLVSIVIPNKDEAETLRTCLESIWKKTTYSNYEIVIVENNSEKRETLEYYRELKAKPGVRLLRWEDEFNYSSINNFGVRHAKGEYVLLMNNDMELITPNWLEFLLGMCQQEDVGIVGCKLFYPDDTIQHAGVIVGNGGVAGHAFVREPGDTHRYFCRAMLQQELSAVTAACMMVKRSVFEEVNGLDEQLKVAFNDVDFCLRVREAGYKVVYEPNVQLYHYESKSRGSDETKKNHPRFVREIKFMQDRWRDILREGDPYYNPNLSLMGQTYTLKSDNE